MRIEVSQYDKRYYETYTKLLFDFRIASGILYEYYPSIGRIDEMGVSWLSDAGKRCILACRVNPDAQYFPERARLAAEVGDIVDGVQRERSGLTNRWVFAHASDPASAQVFNLRAKIWVAKGS